jgi:predicted Zn-dependent protease
MKNTDLNNYLKNIDAAQLTRRDMLTLLALAGGGLVIGCAINPVTGESQLSLMSPAQELEIDKQYAPDQISQDYGLFQDSALQRYVNGVGLKVSKFSHRPEMPYSFKAVNANYMNAYAFPGGTICATRGILLALQNEAELAALLGHEIGHVSARHTASRMSQQTLTGLAVAGLGILLATQVDDNMLKLALGLGGITAGLLIATYSRSDERQADSLGMQYMVKAGYNPKGMIGLMDILQSLSKKEPNMIEQMFSTHPMSTERYASMQREAQIKYTSYMSDPVYRDRYMDATARLRCLKPAIDKQTAGETALMAKKYSEGEDLLKQALKLAPNDYTGLVLMAKAKIIQDQLKESLPYLDRAIRAYPGEEQAPQLKGVVEKKLGDKKAALESFYLAARCAPHNPMIAARIAVLETMA